MRLSQVFRQLCHCLERSQRKACEALEVGLRQEAALVSLDEVIAGFLNGPGRDAEESAELDRVEATESLGDVAGSGAGGAEDLIAEFAITTSRFACRKLHDFFAQFARKLPGNEIFESPNPHALGKSMKWAKVVGNFGSVAPVKCTVRLIGVCT